ncbi:LOW protein: PPR containing protein isoform X1 [Tasmannia lanceolata]|uniref:LOW protein: PPR containing protein isoform X1 n=1 Tax=Tasmannia lanceolata TaxID=3420 RepID=UPI004062F4A4
MALLPGATHLFYLFLLPLPIILLIFKHLKRKPSLKVSLPPGPNPWPIVGNLPHLGKKLHTELARLAQSHGPLISLKLGTQLLVVASSSLTATEILKTHDRLLSARHIPNAVHTKRADLNHLSMGWALECNEKWRFLRTLCRTEVFSAKAIEKQTPLREKKVMEMVEFLVTMEGKVVKVGEVVFATVFNMLGNIFFSENFIGLGDEGVGGGMKGLVWRMMELGATPNLADLYPLVAGLDLQGISRKALDCAQKINAIWEVIIKERRGQGCDAPRQQDFLDIMLERGFSDEQINTLLLELFVAGTDTSSSTIEWAMAELIKNQEAMNKVREELKREIKENMVTEANLLHLPYLQSCVKETLRLHPPAPLLLPHRALDACNLMNYNIPKDSQVQVNVWAIGRDPTTWEDPLSFKPERFLSSSLDYKGNDFEFIPFGAGRRICPGLPMAARQVPFILASLIHCFDWSLQHDMRPSQLDMEEKFGVTLQMEQPLLVIPKFRI